MTLSARRIVLVDNGSLEPAGTLQLRRIAAALETLVDAKVVPVSLAHSDKIAVEQLEGSAAELLANGLERVIAEGAREIVVAPLFVGPSHAITRWMPAIVEEQVKGCGDVEVKIARPLWVEGERRLGEILAEEVRAVAAGMEGTDGTNATGGTKPRIAVVDHGSPARAVTAARDAVAAQVREQLGDAAAEVAACSMERRDGGEFDFNEPLLNNLLARAEWRSGPLVVALLFIAPGRHAGPDGDVAQIVRAARRGETKDVRFTRVLGESPRLVEILAERVRTSGKSAG